MKAKPITPDIFWVGAIDRESRFFDNLIPIPFGTSYNSYLVKGSEKTVLIDTVDPPFVDHLFARLDELGVTKLDYVVANHAEQDHSGCLPDVLLAYPEARVLCSTKCKSMLVDHLHLDPERIDEVQDGDRLPIGGDVLEFLSTPWVHWPETIMTWLPEHRVLFPCDFFGSHLASESLFVARDSEFLTEAKRYYAQIMMPFSGAAKKYTERIRGLAPAVIAPSHGPVIDKPQMILDAYTQWTSGIPSNKATIVYVSMHGSTRLMIEHLVDALIGKGIEVQCFPAAESDLGRIAMELVDSATLILGTPSVLGGPHPHIASIAYLANMLKPKVLHLAVVGSFGWGNKLMSELAPFVSSFKAEVLDPVLLKGLPDAEAMQHLDQLAETIAERHRSIN